MLIWEREEFMNLLHFNLLRVYLLSLLAASGFCFVALAVQGNLLFALDERVASFVQSWESPGLTRIMEIYSWVGSTLPVVVLSLTAIVLFYVLLGFRKELLLLLAAVGGSTIVGYILKSLFGRERPDIHRLAEETGFSFPSSSSVVAVALYGVVTYLLWKRLRNGASQIALAVAAVFLIGCIGLSRVYMGLHYPSDVIGGILAGAAWLLLSIGVFRHINE